MTRMVKRSKRKTMITTGPSQGIGGGITNAFLDPRVQRRCQFARRFQTPGFERRTGVSRRKHRQGFGSVELQNAKT
jgi:hypothetical protein